MANNDSWGADDLKDKRSPGEKILVIIGYMILVLPFIIYVGGWYFNLSPRGKRKFWVVIVAVCILGWLWELLLNSPIFTKTEEFTLPMN